MVNNFDGPVLSLLPNTETPIQRHKGSIRPKLHHHFVEIQIQIQDTWLLRKRLEIKKVVKLS